MYTIKDVAKLAGVSTTTVSRVMNHLGKFSDKTIKTVFDAIDELHYQPNEIARSLNQSKTKVIGVIVPSTSFSLYGKLVSVIEHTAYLNGYKIMVAQTFSAPSLVNDFVDMLQQNMVEGIILASRGDENTDFTKIMRPVVGIGGQKSDDGIPLIRSDNYAAGSIAAKHLISRDCARLGYITGHGGGLLYDLRYKGFQDVCDAAGVQTYPYEIEHSIANQFDENSKIGSIAYSMFHNHPNMDGLFAETDLLAMECIQTAASIGYKIPDTLKVVGFGDLYTSRMLTPPLTTVREDVQHIGEESTRMLLAGIAGEEVDRLTLVPVTLIERKTT